MATPNPPPSPRLPIINISTLLSSLSTQETKLSTALEIDKACRETGFFYITGHNISPQFQDELLSAARTFFVEASEEEKIGIRVKREEEGGDGARGWQRVEGKRKRGKGWGHESLDLFRPISPTPSPPFLTGLGVNRWPSTPPSFRSLAETHIKNMCHLGTIILKAIALALGVDEELLLSKVKEPFWNLRIVAYEGREKIGERGGGGKEGKKSGMPAHTDFGILTFLLMNDTKGSLQVLGKHGRWIDADPVPGALLVNIGQMLQIMTRGLYKATKHRDKYEGEKMRVSVPFFFDPDIGARIEPSVERGEENGKGNGKEEEGVWYRDVFVMCVKYSGAK